MSAAESDAGPVARLFFVLRAYTNRHFNCISMIIYGRLALLIATESALAIIKFMYGAVFVHLENASSLTFCS
jgi:hypothetical protein